MEEAREKKYLEIPLSKILKFRPYRRLLFCIYILFSHDEITIEEIQQKLNSPETFENFKKLWWISIRYLMEKETLISFENWKRCVADNPSVIEFLYNHRKKRQNFSRTINSWTPVRENYFTSDFRRVKMANSRDPRMAKVYDKKSIYYHCVSLKKLLSQEEQALMQPLEDSLRQQDKQVEAPLWRMSLLS